MLYKDLHDIIQNAAESLDYDVTFRHGRRPEINQFHDGTFPLVWLFPINKTGAFSSNSNRLFYTYTCSLGVYQPDKADSTPEDMLKIISLCDKILTHLILKINDTVVNEDEYEDNVAVENVSVQPFFRDTSFVATGMLGSFSITLPDNFKFCC